MTIRFKPFWSYNFLNAEEYLNDMSNEGLHLTNIILPFGIFLFKKGNSENLKYRICYGKNTHKQVPQNLLEAGWECVFLNKKFYFMKTHLTNPSISPSYNDILDRNQIIYFSSGIAAISIFIIFIFMFLGPLGYVVLSNGKITTLEKIVVSHPTTSFIIFMFFIWLCYTFFSTYFSNKKIEKLYYGNSPLESSLLSESEEHDLLLANKIIYKNKYIWYYSLDKTEKWLNEMAQNGYILYKVDSPYNFSFFEKSEKKVKYKIDYKSMVNVNYYKMNIECGWKLIYKSSSRFLCFNIWCHEYEQDAKEPKFYNDITTELRQAKYMALIYSLTYLSMIAIYSAIMKRAILTGPEGQFPWFTLILYLILMFMLLIYEFRIIAYYFRIRSKT